MPKPRQPNRRVLSVRLPAETVARLKALVRDGAGKPLFLTLAGTVEAALNTELDRIETILDASIIDPPISPTSSKHGRSQSQRDNDAREQPLTRRIINNSQSGKGHPSRE